MNSAVQNNINRCMLNLGQTTVNYDRPFNVASYIAFHIMRTFVNMSVDNDFFKIHFVYLFVPYNFVVTILFIVVI